MNLTGLFPLRIILSCEIYPFFCGVSPRGVHFSSGGRAPADSGLSHDLAQLNTARVPGSLAQEIVRSWTLFINATHEAGGWPCSFLFVGIIPLFPFLPLPLSTWDSNSLAFPHHTHSSLCSPEPFQAAVASQLSPLNLWENLLLQWDKSSMLSSSPSQ